MSEGEGKQKKRRKRYRSVLGSMICILAAVAAAGILTAIWIPVLQIYGSSMEPTLQDGQIISFIRTAEFEPGDIVAFYYHNKILVKRIIGGPGDQINIDEDGVVYVNENRLEEPYLTEKTAGDITVELPLQVPEGQYFVMGDHRAGSVDSRNIEIGSISQEQIIGKILFRIWPPGRMGIVN